MRLLGIILALVLCGPDADLLKDPSDVSTPDSGVSVLCPSIGPSPSVIRAKVDKTSTGCLEAPESGSFHLPTHGSLLAITDVSTRLGLMLGCSPLASRPPPLA